MKTTTKAELIVEFSKDPKCQVRECFANRAGRCTILTDNNFVGGCPFFKPKGKK